MSEEEQKTLFDMGNGVSESEAFEMLDAAGIDEITWSKSLNNDYMNWIYLNIK